MSYLLDTNVISELVRPAPNAGVVAWVGQQEEPGLFLSAATWGELRHGAARLPAGARRRALYAWLDQELAPRFEARILAADTAVADAWGEMVAECERRGQAMEAMDGLIAATAYVYDLVLVTRNIVHFRGAGVETLCPWT